MAVPSSTASGWAAFRPGSRSSRRAVAKLRSIHVAIHGAGPGLGAVLLRRADPVGGAGSGGRRRVGVIDPELAGEATRGQAPHEDPEVDAAGGEGPRGAVGEVAQRDVEIDQGRAEAKHGSGLGVEGQVEAVVVARG